MFGALNYLASVTCPSAYKLELVFSGKSKHSNLLLVDFGFSEATPKGQRLKKAVGTLYTMAPEVIRHNASIRDVYCRVVCTLLYGNTHLLQVTLLEYTIYDIKYSQPRYPEE